MDKIDRKIVRELQANARLSNQELADIIGLSPSPCLRRVRKLEEAGVLSGYTAIVDQEMYGLPVNVFVSIRLEIQNNQSIKIFEEGINNLDQVMECYLMTGSRDYLMRVVSAACSCAVSSPSSLSSVLVAAAALAFVTDSVRPGITGAVLAASAVRVLYFASNNFADSS